jgi:N6-adenosine-specific RNA methylase IME4
MVQVPQKYRTIVADPPWPMPSGGKANAQSWDAGRKPSELPYKAMTLADIAALPIDRLAYERAHLYVWTTNAFLEQTYALMREWGFRPSQMLVWAKTPRGYGPGGVFANTTEFVLFGWRGQCSPLQREDTTWWHWPRGTHSAKPEAFLDMVERVSPAPRLEMFARRNRLGWDTWGNESLGHVDIAA